VGKSDPFSSDGRLSDETECRSLRGLSLREYGRNFGDLDCVADDVANFNRDDCLGFNAWIVYLLRIPGAAAVHCELGKLDSGTERGKRKSKQAQTYDCPFDRMSLLTTFEHSLVMFHGNNALTKCEDKLVFTHYAENSLTVF
jgi:hypothetical protein